MSAADKEAALEKPATFAPSLTTKQKPADCNSQDNRPNSPGGYYQNVTQKGKLILPTAIWILIVVGGLCFLSLLSSLNKTMSTLDTLVEIEQANAKLNRESHKENRRENRFRYEKIEPPLSESLFEEREAPSKDNSWLSLPSWASLEPVQRKTSARSVKQPNTDDSINSFIDQLLQSTGFNSGNGPLSGRIALIGVSDSDDGDKSEEKILDSIMGDLMGGKSSDLLASASSGPIRAKAEGPKEQPASTVITANIDELNININSPPAEQAEEHRSKVESPKKRRPKKIQEHRDELRRNPAEEMSALGKSIDSLMASLVDPPAAGPHREHFGEHPSLVFPMPAPYMIRHHPEHHNPAIKPHPHHHLHHDQLHSRIHPFSPMLPLSRLLMPLDPMPQPHSPMDSSIPPMFGRPQMSRLVIALGGDGSIEAPKPPANAADVMAVGLPDMVVAKKTDQLPHQPTPVNSPLDFDLSPSASLPPKLKIDGPNPGHIPIIGIPADDELGNSLMGGLVQAMQNQQSGPGEPHKGDVESLVFINGEPLISGKNSFNEDLKGDNPGKFRNQVNDLFQLFFGAPPDSKLVVAPHITAPKMERVSNNSHKDDHGLFGELKSEHKLEKQPQEEQSKMILSSSNSGDNIPLGVDHLVDNMLGDIFSLPQMNSGQEPIKIDAESSVVKAYQNSTKESMICECHKAGANSTSARPAGQSGAPGGASSNATSAGRPPAGGSGSSPAGGSPSSGGGGPPSGSTARPPGGPSANGSSSQPGNPSSSGGGSASAGGPQSGSGSQSGGGSQPGGGSQSGIRPQSGGTGSSQSQTGSQALNPIGFVPANTAPGAFAVGGAPMATAGQQSGSSSPRPVPQQPPAGGGNFARPGTLLSALNNSTAGIIPRILNRLNASNIPCDGNNSTRRFPSPASLLPFAQQISNLLLSPGQSTPSSPSASSTRPSPSNSSLPSQQPQS